MKPAAWEHRDPRNSSSPSSTASEPGRVELPTNIDDIGTMLGKLGCVHDGAFRCVWL